MSRYRVLAVATKYWRPKTDFLQKIVESIQGKIDDGDILVASEKAISTAMNNITDERTIKPSLSSKLIARYWMRTVWGYFLGRLCHFRQKLLQRLREYPSEMGSRHKQVALEHAGLLQALMFGSEGGIDGSNLPYTYVSLPLDNADEVAQKIHDHVWLRMQKEVCVIIADTDKTYSFRNFHFTPRPKPIKGIHSCGGFLSYVAARIFRLKGRATPIAVAGCQVQAEEALEIAEIANRARGSGAGRTVWDMAERFKVELDAVSWEMLETVKHKPIVIVKRKR